MGRLLKIIGIVVGVLLLGLLIFGWIQHEPLPKGQSGPKADALAHKMLTALNYKAFKNTRILEWSYRNGANHYRWDRQKDEVEIKWGGYKVVLIISNRAHSLVYESDQLLLSEKRSAILDRAIKNFHNDSFWLIAPYKVFDKGTTRSLVTLENGTSGLLVTYASGGTTPGDSYLWLLNENGFPNAYKMWVKIIPIGGLKATWDDWLVTKSGAFLPKTHQLGPIVLDMGNVRGE